jgi:hypothetical protein
MSIFWRRLRRSSIWLLALAALLAACLPAPAASATSSPTWAAWAITVDFPGQQLQVKYIAYTGTNGPPAQVIRWSEQDITTSCTVQGPALTFHGEYAVFDGQTYIECAVPSWRDQIALLAPALAVANSNQVTGDPGFGPIWAAADIRLTPATPATAANPVLDAQELGMTFSLPSVRQPNGSIQAQTRLALNSGSFASPSWIADTTAGNRTLIGEDGPAIVAADARFGWLGFLTNPAWRTFFTSQVIGSTLGSWSEAPVASWKRTPVPAYQLKTRSGTVYIGYSPSTGARFVGEIRSIRFDPGAKGV